MRPHDVWTGLNVDSTSVVFDGLLLTSQLAAHVRTSLQGQGVIWLQRQGWNTVREKMSACSCSSFLGHRCISSVCVFVCLCKCVCV